MPEVLPMASTLEGFEGLAWHAMCAPTGTPQAIVDWLNQIIVTPIACATPQ